MKYILYILILVSLVSLAYGINECTGIVEPKAVPCQVTTTWPYPELCSNYTATLINITGIIIDTYQLDSFGIYCNFTFNHSQVGNYYYNISSGDTGLIIVEAKDDMASLSITIFIVLITIGVFILPFKVRKFSENKYLDSVLKGCCILMGLFLTSLDATMIVTISDNAGLGITNELFTYLFIINWAIYAAMIIVVLSFLFLMLKSWRIDKQKKSMGETD